ncbi:RimJ/RimL family protein N-acetyltransferase [Arthrobacter silviterrae]|uniref:GNAT family N-acetyltransferase n=1 Tax=Arthrobacter silviterrae TaxID=2026658 RepID=A0ABX0D8X0_9MICC|nr:GNAT family protein [Arthrobacter silviterrae]MDQ0279598.1 RimJ/RimL family protein N-acetyltransferase [Arthrobacter silviterrae]NGN81925.1 GNAT family N-acetyltransferase [Arthrobacter silviterrae]
MAAPAMEAARPEITTPGPRLSDGATVLRRFSAAGAAAYAAIHRDPLNVQWAGSDPSMTAESAAVAIRDHIDTGWDDGRSLRFAVEELVDGNAAVVGTVSVHDVLRTASGGSASVGIKMLPAGRGQGSAARAIRLLCGYAFGTLGLDALHWRATVGNLPSRRLAERCGFVLAAEIPGYGHVDGGIAAGWVFVLTAAQWLGGPSGAGRSDAGRSHADPGEAGLPVRGLELEPVVPRLSDGSVVLRALADRDAPQLVENCTDPDAVRWTTVPLGYTSAHAAHFIGTITPDGWRSGKVLTFAVASAESDEFYGTVDLQCNDPGTASIGILMGTHARGTGAAEQAVRLLAGYAFDQLNLGYLHWHALVPNWGSRKLAWKLGFRLEAEVRGGYNDRGTPGDRWTLSLAAGDPRTPQEPWTGPDPLTR